MPVGQVPEKSKKQELGFLLDHSGIAGIVASAIFDLILPLSVSSVKGFGKEIRKYFVAIDKIKWLEFCDFVKIHDRRTKVHRRKTSEKCSPQAAPAGVGVGR